MTSDELTWDDEASERIRQVPFFVRPFVRRQVERAARERGLTRVTAALLEELRRSRHPGG